MITSIHNQKVQFVRRLLTRRKERNVSNSFVGEGVRLLEEAQFANWIPELVLYSDELSLRGNKLLAAFRVLNVDIEEVKPDILNQVCQTETSQGILAVFKRRDLPLPHRLDFILIIDQLRDPGNMGTILRSAAAAGVQAVLLTPGTTDVFSPKVLRSGMGAQFKLPVLYYTWEKINHICRQENRQQFTMYLTSTKAELPYWNVDFRKPSVIIIGNEADGISNEVKKYTHIPVNIPMPGGSESLNAAVAAGIIMFEVVRQRTTV